MTDSPSEQEIDLSSLPRILVVRPDRLGDVILSTPVFEAIKQTYPQSKLTVLLRDNVLPLLKESPSIDAFLTFDPLGRHSGFKGFFRLYSEIKEKHFGIAVVLQSHWKIAAVLFLARIRYRIGPWSKPYSFIFYNRGVRQRRSQVEMHEADYNLQLLRRMGVRAESRKIPTHVVIPEASQKNAQTWLTEKGFDSKKPLILVHPGMGGSALNWPEPHYCELIKCLVENERQVLVTGGPTETSLLNRISDSLGELQKKVFFYKSQENSTVDFLGGLFQFADVVVAPSTGPLHLAVALNKPVVTFYPPIRVQSALRWGPYLPDETRASVLVPEVYCGQDFECLGSLCNYFPCMKSLTVRQTLRQVEKQLGQGQRKS